MNTFWQSRIRKADRAYKQWANQFKCKILEDYYEGRQWKTAGIGEDPYVVNLVFSTIEIKSANILLTYPKYSVTPKPGNADYSQEFAIRSAQIKEDVLNTIIDNDSEAFVNACNLAYLDSQFRFGVIEVGYAEDWVRNPLISRPLLNNQVTEPGEDTEENPSEDIKIADMPQEVLASEKIYFKHIPASRFRVGAYAAPELSRCDWFGYYEFVYLNDLKAIKGLKSDWLDQQVTTSSNEPDASNISGNFPVDEEKSPAELVKIYHLFDVRARKRFLYIDESSEIILEDEWKRVAIMDLRWHLRTKGWYPMPPVFNWLSPQNEYNESREMGRTHRRRFKRKFAVVGDDVEQEEIDKFLKGEDGIIVKLPRADAIKAIEDPQLNTLREALILSKDDFNEVAGVSSADRGRTDRTTATEAQRIAMKSDVRESAESFKYKTFLNRLGKEALMLMAERFEDQVWMKLESDPGEQFLGDGASPDGPVYEQIQADALNDGYDFSVAVDIISSSPLVNEDEKKHFVEFLTVVNQYPQIALSPMLVREAAYRCGYRNERVIREMQKIAQVTMLGLVNQQAGQAGQASQSQTQQSQMQTPSIEQTQNQLARQVI